MTNPAPGRWYDAMYIRYQAPVFCRKFGDEVQVLSRIGLWTVSRDRAPSLLSIGPLADEAAVARRLIWNAIPERKRPNSRPLAELGGRLPSDYWYRAVQVDDRPERRRFERSYIRNGEGDDSFKVYDGNRSVDIVDAAHVGQYFAIFVDVDGEAVACSPVENANVEAIHRNYL